MGEVMATNNAVEPMENKFLSFQLEDSVYAIEVKYISGIMSVPPITTVPESPDYMKGIINLRGKVIPVIDLRVKLSREEIDYDERTCVIIVETKDISVALVVDRVREVLNIDDDKISPPPDYKSGMKNKHLLGVAIIGESVILLIDALKLLSDSEIEELSKVQAQ